MFIIFIEPRGMPLFMPSHLSKYLFPFSASVKLLDWLPPHLEALSERASLLTAELDELGGPSALALIHRLLRPAGCATL